MIPYSAPTRDMQFLFDEMGLLGQLQSLPGCEDATPDLVSQILDEANKLASGVLAPLNYSGDKQGAQIENGVVRTADGWKEAYRHYVDGGWNSVPFSPDYGGQGLPWAITIGPHVNVSPHIATTLGTAALTLKIPITEA